MRQETFLKETHRETLGYELLEADVLDFLEGRTREVQCERTLIPLSFLEADWREPPGSSFRGRKTYALHGEYTRVTCGQVGHDVHTSTWTRLRSHDIRPMFTFVSRATVTEEQHHAACSRQDRKELRRPFLGYFWQNEKESPVQSRRSVPLKMAVMIGRKMLLRSRRKNGRVRAFPSLGVWYFHGWRRRAKTAGEEQGRLPLSRRKYCSAN